MGIFQIKFNLSLSIGYTPIITESRENVKGSDGHDGHDGWTILLCGAPHRFNSNRLDRVGLELFCGKFTVLRGVVGVGGVPVFFICSASIITIHMNLSKT